MGHPVLLKTAIPVEDPGSPDILRLIDNMADTMIDACGAGLAAPQVHVSLRIMIFHVQNDRAEHNEESMSLRVLINPEIKILDAKLDVDMEACLSIPGLVGLVPRARKIYYRGHDSSGRLIEEEAEGFHARVVQHEYDHLDGILYPMRMTDLSTLAFRDELGRSVINPEQSNSNNE